MESRDSLIARLAALGFTEYEETYIIDYLPNREFISKLVDRIEGVQVEVVKKAAAILRREIERVDAIAPQNKGKKKRNGGPDLRHVTLTSVCDEYALIEEEILALAPNAKAATLTDGGEDGLV